MDKGDAISRVELAARRKVCEAEEPRFLAADEQPVLATPFIAIFAAATTQAVGATIGIGANFANAFG